MSTKETAQRILSLFHKLKRELQHSAHEPTHPFHDLTMLQAQALFCVKAQGKTTMSDLANALGLSAPSATSLVDRLVEQNLLVRSDDPNDRRVVNLAVAEPAKKALAKALERKLDRFAELLEPLSAAEQTELVRIIEKIHTHRKEEHAYSGN